MITFISGTGNTAELRNDFPYKILSFEGEGGTQARIQSQKAPFQDGQTYIDTTLNMKESVLTIGIKADNEEQLYERRAALSKAFNPKSGVGVLTYENAGRTLELEVTPKASPYFLTGADNATTTFQRCEIELTAPHPYWRTPSIEEEPTFEGLFSFPFEGTFQMGIQRDKRIITNDGDAPSPIQVEFYGPATNPRIENTTTGEYIKVNQTLGENEYMKIDTTPGKKSVVFVEPDGTERNVFNWIDLESTFFDLVLGENEIVYTADSDIQGAEVNIYWQKQFVGV